MSQEKMIFLECLMPEGGRLKGYGTYQQGEIAEVPESLGLALIQGQPHNWKRAVKRTADKKEE